MAQENMSEQKENGSRNYLDYMKKPNIDPIKDTLNKPIVSKILSNAYLGLLCYAVIFILGEILISGGRSEYDPYFIAFEIIFLIAAQVVFIQKKNYSSSQDTIISAVSVTVTIALLDYLLVNLWLEKNSMNIYSYWPVYLVYLTALVTPFIRSNWNKLSSINLKPLLTKKS